MNAKLVSFLWLSIMVSFLSGCADENVDDSALPWATPASWEGRLPGFGAGSNY